MRPTLRRFLAVFVTGFVLLDAGLHWFAAAGPTVSASPAKTAPRAPGERPAQPCVPPSGAATAPAATPAPEDADIARFDAWLARYRAASPAERLALAAEGRSLATARRTALAALIRRDPRRALDHAVPMVARQELPADIVPLLEARVSARGSLGVLGVVGGPAATEPIRRTVELTDGSRYEAYVFGRRALQRTTDSINVTGIAVDRALALDERPLRVLEAGEIPSSVQPAVETCLVSGRSTVIDRRGDRAPPITQETPAVEIAGTVHYLCSGGHIQVVEERLVAAEGASGGPVKPTGTIAGSWSTGVRSLLYMRIAFPDTNQPSQTETAAIETMRQVNDWFVENSYGNLYLVTTVTPVIMMPQTSAWYASNDGTDAMLLRADALAAARAAGWDSGQYDLDIVAYTGGSGGFGGQGYVGGKGTWIKSASVGVICHELGHNFGVWHANFWNTSGASAIGNGSNTEYGNIFDTMGSAGAGDLQFNANHKSLLNWLPSGPFVHPVSTSGTYRIFAYDQNQLDPAKRYALHVAKDSDREYWAEFRQRSLSANKWTKDGLLLNWSAWAGSNAGAQLLDTTPGSPDDRTDAALTIGRTFSDLEAGVHITPIGKGGTTPESLDVVVNVGSFPGNQPPTLSIVASTVTAALNASVSFTATAADPDGDALAFVWDFNDKTVSNSNSANVAKSWSVAGDYTVRCIASDMKGGTASRAIVVRVGAPSTFRASGQVLLGGQPLANVRVHNGLTGASYRGTFTNSDGTFTISGLTATSYTFAAALDGYSFAASGFVNPLAVAGDVSGVDFAATVTPTVSLAVNDADCVEGANTGRVTLTRTGSTASALAVRFLYPTGTATKGSDYTLLPDLVSASPYYTATIPAGAATLDLVVTATDDVTAEGPESATLELAPGPGYTIAGPSVASLVIQDNDTAKPVVSLRVIDPTADESGDTASFLVSRTGAPSGDLVVNLTVTGTATPNSDYVSLGSSVTIPDGANSVARPLIPIQDGLVEGSETVTVTIATGTTYVRTTASADYATTFNLLDDDIPTVTVVATDAAAAEAGADPGVFTITRTGDTSQPLTVNYTLSGSAAQGVDYLPLPGVLTLPAGSSSGTVTILPLDDTLGEPTQTVVLQLRAGTTYVVGAAVAATVNITDNADLPVVAVNVIDGTAAEPSDVGKFRFTTTGTGAGTINVKYTVTGTATPGADYTTLSGTAIVSRNSTSDLTVTPLDDTLPEDWESVTVTITPDAAYTTFLDNSATLYIADNDQPQVSVQGRGIAAETGTVATFYLTRSVATATPLDVNYTLSGTALNGTDYTLLSGLATIPANATSATVVIAPINDTLTEGTETIVMTLAPGGYGIGLASSTVYLTDNETPTTQVRFTSATGTSAETAGTILVPVTLSAPAPAGGITVEYVNGGGSALSGVDYQFPPGVLTFAAGESAKTLSLTILDDPYQEPSQTVLLRLQNANGAALGTSTYTHTITDDDTNTVTIAATSPNAAEFGSVPGVFTVTRTGSTFAARTVRFTTTGSATDGADFTSLGSTVVIPAGQSSAVVTVTPSADALAEGNETVTLTLVADSGYLVGAPASATVAIADRPIDAWRTAKFGAQANVGAVAGDFADPDGDGLVNLLEYAANREPLGFSPPATVVGYASGNLSLTYRRNLAAIDLSFSIEQTGDLLQAWQSVVPAEQVLADDRSTRTIQASVPAAGGAQFLRLRVTRL